MKWSIGGLFYSLMGHHIDKFGEFDRGIWRSMSFGAGSSCIMYLLFADDSLLFFMASLEVADSVKKVLDIYCAMSGQSINLQKSNAYFSNRVSEGMRHRLCEKLEVQCGETNGKYLGLSFMIGRTKRQVFQYLEERVRKKVSGWKENYLTSTGKEVLIKSVLQVIPTCAMQCFLLPQIVCNTLTSIIRSFWWNSSGKERSINWKSWNALCHFKRQGGLGFRNMCAFNLAMLAKQEWRLLQSPHSLAAKMMQAKYFPVRNFLTATLSSRPSFLWRSILAGREDIELGLQVRIGDGTSVNAWTDPCFLRPNTFRPCPSNCVLLPNVKVST